jgi:hypothetical protein
MSVAGSGVGGTATGVSGKNITLSQSATASGTNVSVTFWVPVNNTAIVQMIGLGQCPAGGNLAAQVPYLVINEVTTVAFAYAMGGFGTDAYHIGSSGTPLAQTAIANAMANSYNIAGIGWGGALPVANGNSNSVAPQAKINTLADIIATCVNTSSATSTQCTNIFTNAKNSSNVTPTDESTALFNIVQNPDANVAAIWARFPATPVFSPTLSTQPTDWTLPVVYKNVVSSRPGNIAFDSFGNAWISDRSSNAVVRATPQGTVTKFTNLNNGSSNGGTCSFLRTAAAPASVCWATRILLRSLTPIGQVRWATRLPQPSIAQTTCGRRRRTTRLFKSRRTPAIRTSTTTTHSSDFNSSWVITSTQQTFSLATRLEPSLQQRFRTGG